MSAVNSNGTNGNGSNGSSAVPKPREEWLAKRRAENRDGLTGLVHLHGGHIEKS